MDLDIILKMCDASVCDGGINMRVQLVGILTLSVLISEEMGGKFSHVQKNSWHTWRSNLYLCS